MSRSTAPREVIVLKTAGEGELPPFIPLFHRHFQKAKPFVGDRTRATLVANVDLLDLLVPESFLNKIESIEIVYQKAGK